MTPRDDERAVGSDRAAPRSADRGVTFVELLVAIVLLGTAVVGTLTALRATVIGTGIDRNHANAYAWLQSAADSIALAPYLSCSTYSNTQILATYDGSAQGALRPVGWETGSGATVHVTSVAYLSRSGTSETWGSTCAAADAESALSSQLVIVEVASPDGDFTASLEVIKRA